MSTRLVRQVTLVGIARHMPVDNSELCITKGCSQLCPVGWEGDFAICSRTGIVHCL